MATSSPLSYRPKEKKGEKRGRDEWPIKENEGGGSL